MSEQKKEFKTGDKVIWKPFGKGVKVVIEYFTLNWVVCRYPNGETTHAKAKDLTHF